PPLKERCPRRAEGQAGCAKLRRWQRRRGGLVPHPAGARPRPLGFESPLVRPGVESGRLAPLEEAV
ncbi:MAG: hypothetical protein ACO2PM_08840, partial [Pyrobaculum sp.]